MDVADSKPVDLVAQEPVELGADVIQLHQQEQQAPKRVLPKVIGGPADQPTEDSQVDSLRLTQLATLVRGLCERLGATVMISPFELTINWKRA